ncbi:MAG: SRPBCC domain-containing protein [Pirellulaceae bacterium]
MIRNAPLALVLALAVCLSAFGQDSRMVDECEIDASIEDVWSAFTTSKGLKSWVAPLADIDLRVGGKWRANYNKNGKLGDETTIENTILCYDPQRMLSIKATGFPKGFEFVEAAKETWSIFYFTKVSDKKTKITIVGLGYTESEQSKKMRAFFKPANEYSMKRLKTALENKVQDEKSDR